MMRRHLLRRALCAALVIATPACKSVDPSRHVYRIEVHSKTPDGRPVEGVEIFDPSSEEPLITDEGGRSAFDLSGREGEEVTLRIVKLPPNYRLASGNEEQHILLKNVGQSGPQAIAIRHDITLRSTRESYVLLVAAEQTAGLKVAANGVAVGMLNSRGAGAFRLEGKPGDELKVAILTEGDPRYSVQDPDKVFSLPENGGLLSFVSSLSLNPEPIVEKKAKAKHHLKLKATPTPTQIPFQQTVSVRPRH